MKSIITFILCLVFSFGLAQKKSSATNSKKFTFGVKAGGNINHISGNDAQRNIKMKISFHGGIFANYKLNQKMRVQMESSYQHFATNMNYKADTLVKGKWTLNHIAIPVFFQYEFIPNFYAETGPELDIILAGKQILFDTRNYNIQKEADFKKTGYVKSLSFGWALGAGYYFTPNFGVNLRYTMGLTSPYITRNGLKADQFRMHNVQVGLMARF